MKLQGSRYISHAKIYLFLKRHLVDRLVRLQIWLDCPWGTAKIYLLLFWAAETRVHITFLNKNNSLHLYSNFAWLIRLFPRLKSFITAVLILNLHPDPDLVKWPEENHQLHSFLCAVQVSPRGMRSRKGGREKPIMFDRQTRDFFIDSIPLLLLLSQDKKTTQKSA